MHGNKATRTKVVEGVVRHRAKVGAYGNAPSLTMYQFPHMGEITVAFLAPKNELN